MKESAKEKLRAKAKARHLVLNKGITQKEAAKCVGISERTICAWAKKHGWRRLKMSFKARENQKLHAFALIALKGTTRKEAAKVVGVSTRTIHTWENAEGWKAALQNVKDKTKGFQFLFDDFISYLRNCSPEIAPIVEGFLHEFLAVKETILKEHTHSSWKAVK